MWCAKGVGCAVFGECVWGCVCTYVCDMYVLDDIADGCNVESILGVDGKDSHWPTSRHHHLTPSLTILRLHVQPSIMINTANYIGARLRARG